MPFVIKLARTRYVKIQTTLFPTLVLYCCGINLESGFIPTLSKELQNFVSFNFGHFAFSDLSGPSIDHGNVGKGLVTYLVQSGKGKEARRGWF